ALSESEDSGGGHWKSRSKKKKSSMEEDDLSQPWVCKEIDHFKKQQEGCPPVRQKKRGQAVDKNQAIQEEVWKLVEAGIMKEVHYHDWFSNPVMMPFGLRNAGETYHRRVDKEFHKQIGRNLKVYMDDLVIKSRTEDEIVRDIEETFKTLREINMKLNPKVKRKVNTKGLKVCPDKVDAVLSLPSPKCLKDVQKLNGKSTPRG
ncbi:hypothetical protein Tco_1521951, partial [Tanacetum coccineum]